ncbi:MAG: DNA-binding protein WhiA [Erysipelotrichales bacterium]|nr:DNA-binding protein WhiA [Erysipelotrichales bacterium]
MSFAKECKDEIIEGLILKDCCEKTFLAYFSNYFKLKDNHYYYSYYNQELLKKLADILNSYYQIEAIIKKNEVLISENDFIKISGEQLQRNCCKTTLLKSAFLHSGTITKPKMELKGNKRNNYHLEIITRPEEGKILQRIFNQHDQINAVLTSRRNNLILYIKNKEDISGFLKLSGAISQASYLEEVIISQLARAKAARKTNCVMSNDYKATTAANRQIKEIQYIKKNLPSEVEVPESIVELMEIRLKHPDKNLNELCDLYSKRNQDVSKSCLNHRFRKISRYYKIALEATTTHQNQKSH